MRLLTTPLSIAAFAALAKPADKGHADSEPEVDGGALFAGADAGAANGVEASAEAVAEAVDAEPGSGDGETQIIAGDDAPPADVEALKARIAELEAENADLTSAAETGIGELKAALADAEAARDEALAELKKARKDLASAQRVALKSPGVDAGPVDAGEDGAADSNAAPAEGYVVMQTSRVRDVSGSAIARGRVAIGQPATLAGLIEAGRARQATVGEARAAEPLAVID